jgi:hypothetical protein
MRSREFDEYQEPLGPFSWVWLFNWFVLRAFPVAAICVTAAAGVQLYLGLIGLAPSYAPDGIAEFSVR